MPAPQPIASAGSRRGPRAISPATQMQKSRSGAATAPRSLTARRTWSGWTHPRRGPSIDWDADGNPLAAPLYATQDVNYSGGVAPFADPLAGSEDWPNLRLNRIGIRRNVGALYLDPDTNLFTVGPTSVGLGKGDAGKGDAGVQDLGKGDARQGRRRQG